ncbi:hypothetical protein FI667_g14095, partial [Globisporangium splendens]
MHFTRTSATMGVAPMATSSLQEPDTESASMSPDLSTTPTLAYVRATREHSRASSVSCGDDTDGNEKLAVQSSRETTRLYLRVNGVLIIYSSVAFMLLLLLFHLSFFAAKMDDDNGAEPEFIGCRSWAYDDNCGLNGIDCRPFESDWSAFRCPTKCNVDGSSSLAVYGSGPYRADSRICRAAIHAGVIGSNGGCGYYKYSGAANAFYGSPAHGVDSREYLSWFPKTIEFKKGSSSYCTDLSWGILAIAIAIFFGYALLPRTNPAMLYYGLVAWGFVYVRMIAQTASVDYTGIALRTLGEVFVLVAASSFVFRLAPAYTFSNWNQLPIVRRMVLWGVCYVLPYHLLLHLNFISFVPWLNFDIGGYENTHTNAGTYIVIACIVVIALVCAFVFLRQLYRVGIWKKYVLLYFLLVSWVLISWALFHSTDFHLHHTMLSALIIPFTRFPTPLAAAAQSAALGGFVQGYAAWGWSSYLETIPTYLAIERPSSPPVVLNVTATSANISWEPLKEVDGYSLRLNSVEVYRGLDTNTTIANLEPNLTYFLTVAGVASWGTNGRDGPEANFTTLVN